MGKIKVSPTFRSKNRISFGWYGSQFSHLDWLYDSFQPIKDKRWINYDSERIMKNKPLFFNFIGNH